MRRFARSNDGNVAVVMGVAFGVIATAAGMAVDYATVSSKKSNLQDIVDAAALAGAGVAERPNSVRMETVRDAIRTHGVNFEGDLSAKAVITFDENRSEVRVTVPYTQKLAFAGLIGRDALDIDSTAAVSFTATDVVPITIAFALDSSGSMNDEAGSGQPKIDVLRDSIDLLFEELENAAVRPDLLDRSLRTSLAAYNFQLLESRDTAYGWDHLGPTIDNLVAGGGTNSTPALWHSYQSILKDRAFRVSQEPDYIRDQHKEFVLFMTDGNNNRGWSDRQSSNLCRQMRDDGILIYSVAFAAPEKGQLLLLDCASFNTDADKNGIPNEGGCNLGRGASEEERDQCRQERMQRAIEALRPLKSDFYYDADDADSFRQAFADIGRDISGKTVRVLR